MDDTDSTVIGLDVRGQVFYCNKSKLLEVNNGNSYFSARFREDSMLDAGLDRVDNEGRHIYKLDRDPSIFQHIIEYIDTGLKPLGIGVHENNKKLWGLVREEALYFGIDSLVQLLRITFSCSPEDDGGGKGIMYWLGTKKGISHYVNPYSSGAVDISGWLDDKNIFNKIRGREPREEDRKMMVQYRPNQEGDEIIDMLDEVADANDITHEEKDIIRDIFAGSFGAMMGCRACDSDRAGGTINFHLLKSVAVSPTHYSIRNGGCYGMSGDWNLEASVDGKNWDVIHEARGRQPKLFGGLEQNEDESFMGIWNMALSCETESRMEAVCDYMEENHRQTWRVNNNNTSNFYTHFRFLSIEIPEEEGEWEVEGNERYRCLHGVSFELYGDVCEEWEDESKSKTRNEQLENQVMELTGQNEKLQTHNTKLQTHNEALSREVESLKARVRLLEGKRSAEEACLSAG